MSSASREHVIPQAFGKFRSNLVLHCVCAACNHFFSTELERPFAHDSGEAFVRMYFGLRDEESAADTSCVTTFNVPGPWFGANVRVRPSRTGATLPEFELLPQIGFQVGGQWKWVLEKDICLEKLRGIDPGPGVKFACHLPKDRARLEQKLTDLGFRLGEVTHYEEKPIGGVTLQVHLGYTFNQVMQRCVAKIGFNYLAWACSPVFALNSSFDPIRSYIRFGEWKEASGPIYVGTDTMMVKEAMVGREVRCHFIALRWHSQDELHSVVSLFGVMRYVVVLARRYKSVWIDVHGGHFFDPKSHEIGRLTSLRFAP